MPKSRKLSSIFRSALKSTASSSSSATTAAAAAIAARGGDKTLKKFASSLEPSSKSPSISSSIPKRLKKLTKPSSGSPAGDSSDSILNLIEPTSGDSTTTLLSEDISSILCDVSSAIPPSSSGTNGEKSIENALDVPWFPNLSQNNISLRRKEVSRARKQQWIYKFTQAKRIQRLVDMCAMKLGTEATIQVFGKLGRETGVKEYNALIKICIETAKTCDEEDVAFEQISQAFQLFNSMKEQGFQLSEETYGPLLMFLIDMGMESEFHSFCSIIKDNNPCSFARLGYYEMLLHIRVNNEDKIQELCNYISTEDGDETFNLGENYLLALCESGQKSYLLHLLRLIDVKKISSLDHMSIIFKSLGTLMLESFAEKFLLALKNCDYGAENISTLIFCYVTSIPNLVVEDVMVKFKSLHTLVEMTPSSNSYEKLIVFTCKLQKVHAALDIAHQMCEAGLTLSIDTLHSLLNASEEGYEFNLVRRIYSLIGEFDLKPNNETFRSMINLYVKMKDFEGAYAMLGDLEKFNLMPTTGMYNAIIAGYFREKSISGALSVLKQMKLADVKPDSQTYSYLIGNCDSEEKIIKYYEELKYAGIQVSKQIFMSLINAYAACGQFEKARQVLLDKGIPIKHLNEIKSVLVSALASHGQISDAIDIYEGMKEAGCHPEPKATLSLIEQLQSEKDHTKLLMLLEDLRDPDYWVDGCCRALQYCVRNKHLRSVIALLKQLKDRYHDDELAMEVILDEVFSVIPDTEPTDLQIGLDLLQLVKNELGISPSRKSLDFLLSACVSAKDLDGSLMIWNEYKAAGLPYNVISYLKMYQALLATGGRRSAKAMLSNIPKDDPHVRSVIHACLMTYGRKKNEIATMG